MAGRKLERRARRIRGRILVNKPVVLSGEYYEAPVEGNGPRLPAGSGVHTLYEMRLLHGAILTGVGTVAHSGCLPRFPGLTMNRLLLFALAPGGFSFHP
jgi:hypothetical protein